MFWDIGMSMFGLELNEFLVSFFPRGSMGIPYEMEASEGGLAFGRECARRGGRTVGVVAIVVVLEFVLVSLALDPVGEGSVKS